MEDTGNEEEDLQRDRAIGAAFAALGNATESQVYRDEFQKLLDAEKGKQTAAVTEAETKAKEAKSDDKAIEKAKKDAEQKFASSIRRLERAIQEIDGRAALVAGDAAKALEHLQSAEISADQLALVMMKAGKTDDAIKKADGRVKSNSGETIPLATLTEIQFAAGKKDEAKVTFESLRKISETVDLTAGPFARLAPIAAEFGFPADWRLALEKPADLGTRPSLDALGPFRWAPGTASDWTLADVEGKSRSLHDYKGRPVVVVFYLGYGCLHCAEQLKAITAKYEDFRKAGLEVVAVSTDKQENLSRASKDLEKPYPFPLVADPEMAIFRQYRCYDDFEKAALHGTFLIDAQGRIRWQDISYEPFMDTDFLLKESGRLLSFDPSAPEKKPATSVGSGQAVTGF